MNSISLSPFSYAQFPVSIEQKPIETVLQQMVSGLPYVMHPPPPLTMHFTINFYISGSVAPTINCALRLKETLWCPLFSTPAPS
jgi:hypothetical protein